MTIILVFSYHSKNFDFNNNFNFWNKISPPPRSLIEAQVYVYVYTCVCVCILWSMVGRSVGPCERRRRRSTKGGGSVALPLGLRCESVSRELTGTQASPIHHVRVVLSKRTSCFFPRGRLPRTKCKWTYPCCVFLNGAQPSWNGLTACNYGKPSGHCSWPSPGCWHWRLKVRRRPITFLATCHSFPSSGTFLLTYFHNLLTSFLDKFNPIYICFLLPNNSHFQWLFNIPWLNLLAASADRHRRFFLSIFLILLITWINKQISHISNNSIYLFFKHDICLHKSNIYNVIFKINVKKKL